MYQRALKNATIVEETGPVHGNIYMADGKIAAITDVSTDWDAADSIDVAGKLVFPGLIDSHAHLGDPNHSDVETTTLATTAAAIGGFTTCIDMPNNDPAILNGARFHQKLARMERESMVDYALYGALVKDNQGELAGLDRAGAIAFKSFLSCGGGDFTPPTMYEARLALQQIQTFDGLAAFHCEDTSINEGLLNKMIEDKVDSRQAFLDSRPLCAELIATKSMIELARDTGCRLQICHVSHPLVAKAIGDAQAEGVDVTGETCVHYLVFSEEDLLEKGCYFKCAPPLRSRAASQELWQYVENGVLSCLGSDHSPGLPEERDDRLRPVYKLNNGISGIQTVLQTFYDRAVNVRGNCPSLIAKRMAADPARRFGLYGRKGAIKVGFDADFVVLDPERAWEVSAQSLYYKQKFSAFVGMRGKGLPVMTLLRGEVIAKDSAPTGKLGYAQFLRRDKQAES